MVVFMVVWRYYALCEALKTPQRFSDRAALEDEAEMSSEKGSTKSIWQPQSCSQGHVLFCKPLYCSEAGREKRRVQGVYV